MKFIIVLFFVVLISGCVALQTNNKTKDGFCGTSTNGSCSSDSDCITGGCSGEICQSAAEEPVYSTCVLKDCYNANAYGMACKCVDGRCAWH